MKETKSPFDHVPRDGYGRCRQCGGPFSDDTQHITSCRYYRAWRPLLMSEYPPPGPTRTLPPKLINGNYVAPLEVYALVNT